MPIANGFLTPDDFSREYFFELAPGFCSCCGMVQLVEQPAPEQMFHENYAFFSGTSRHMAHHFHRFADSVMEGYLSQVADPFVVEIGSNDGIMLQHFAKRNVRHLGIEPSKNVAAVARQKGVNTISEFFNLSLAEQIVQEHGQADAFIAANVMCHIADFRSVVEGICRLVKPTGVICFEDPYMGSVIENTSYDQFYDEHVFLFSLASISYAFREFGMEVIDVQPQSTHGGSMRYIIGHTGERQPTPAVSAVAKRELELGLHLPETYQAFRVSCERSRDALRETITGLREQGKRVTGYAATSKSTTVINYCGLSSELIECISDTTPIKQGRFSPGAHIPVVPYERFTERYPDAAVLFAYNHQEEIFAKESGFRESGGKWVMFVPRVEVL
jgi:methylation protein EvaC